jgi:hypothetical protein
MTTKVREEGKGGKRDEREEVCPSPARRRRKRYAKNDDKDRERERERPPER